MGFKCGIVGLPNVGKSSLFNALTNNKIESANYPFCTIEPNSGVVNVPDIRLSQLSEIVNPQKVVPTIMEFVDIAGLVQGASKGEGLGNQFLSHIRQTNSIIHLIRCFENDDVIHVSGRVDPISDLEIINTELILADLGSIEKAIDKQKKKSKAGDKNEKQQLLVLEKLREKLLAGKMINEIYESDFDDNDYPFINSFQLLTQKKQIIVANVDDETMPENNPHFLELKKYCEQKNLYLLALCTKLEEEISEFSEDEKKEFLSQIGMNETGLSRLIKSGYEMLGLMTYFTAGVKEVRAWTIKKGDSAPKAAAKIHNDFEKGFIRAEVISFADYLECKGEAGSKAKGKMRLEGKEYIVEDGDVIHFRFNV